jgi:hypothetical protein
VCSHASALEPKCRRVLEDCELPNQGTLGRNECALLVVLVSTRDVAGAVFPKSRGREDQPGSVAPTTTVLVARNAGAPQPVDPTPYADPALSEICGFPVQVMSGGKSKELVLPGDRIKVIFPDGNLEDVLTGRNVVAFDNSSGHPFANSVLFVTGRYSLVIDPATGSIDEPPLPTGRSSTARQSRDRSRLHAAACLDTRLMTSLWSSQYT